jgi:hypothetical protein
MNYLEEEIDSTIREHSLPHKKMSNDEIDQLVFALKKIFLNIKAKHLDPTHLNQPKKSYDPDFWKKIDKIQNLQNPILIVQDRKIHVWEFETPHDLTRLLSETTGFPFWITSKSLTFLAYMDDHNCIHTSQTSTA